MESSSELELLKTMVQRTEPKPSWYVTVSGNSSEINTTFSPPLSFPTGCNYEMACCGLETYYSFPNIDKENNSIKVSVDGGKKWTVLQVPIGCYEIKAIDETLRKLVKEKVKGKATSLSLFPNRNTLKCELKLDDTTQVDFRGNDGSLRVVLGFEEKIYKGPKRFESEKIVNILRVNSVFIHCDVITLSRKNGLSSPIIYNFFPNVSPGFKIVERPRNLIYLPLSLNVISQMKVWLTDQYDNVLDLRGEELTITFHVKAC